MISGWMPWSGPGAIVLIFGMMNAQKYISILQENLAQGMEATCLLGDMPLIKELIFQQDNDP